MTILKPQIKDLKSIESILLQWTDPEEALKYVSRIKAEIEGQTEYSMNFWVISDEKSVVGIGGLAQPLPRILSLARTKKPGEIKILYINGSSQGRGFGKQMISFLEKEAKNQGYQELFIRSAQQYQNTAYGFYQKMGYEGVGQTENKMAIFYKRL